MKIPFDLEKAKNGAKIVTRDGRSVEILKYDYTKNGNQRLVVCSKNSEGDNYVYIVPLNGACIEGMEYKSDLFIEVEPTYRPYANAKEMDEAIKKHGAFVKDSYGVRSAIKGYDDSNAAVGTGCTYGALLECYKWLDGTPCGVQEGGDNE